MQTAFVYEKDAKNECRTNCSSSQFQTDLLYGCIAPYVVIS